MNHHRTLIVAAALSAAAILPAAASAADQGLLLGVVDHAAATAQLGSCRTVSSCTTAGRRAAKDVTLIATRVSARAKTHRPSQDCFAAWKKLYPKGLGELDAAKLFALTPSNGTLRRYYLAASATDKAAEAILAC